MPRPTLALPSATAAPGGLRPLDQGLDLDNTLRQWMIAAGMWKTRAQRRKPIQQPRHRRDFDGELAQIDGSDHHWSEDRGRRAASLAEPAKVHEPSL